MAEICGRAGAVRHRRQYRPYHPKAYGGGGGGINGERNRARLAWRHLGALCYVMLSKSWPA